jgi:hypothetical protein
VLPPPQGAAVGAGASAVVVAVFVAVAVAVAVAGGRAGPLRTCVAGCPAYFGGGRNPIR